MTLRVRIAAPPEQVHRALTDPEALRTWLAEHAEVDLTAGRYQFWGRYTPEGHAPHQRLLHHDQHTLRLSWHLGGDDTTTEIHLEPEKTENAENAGSTILTLTQTHVPDLQEAIAGTSVRGVLLTFWALATVNLADYVEGREVGPRADFTSPEMRGRVLIDALPDAVYDSLIDPQKFRQWFGANVEIEPYVGGRFAMGGFELDESPAKIIDLEPGSKMTMRWDDGTVAGWELEGSGGKTWLTFVQSGFDNRPPDYGAWMGWLAGVAELRRFHELPGWRPLWITTDVPGMPEGMLAT
jgi:uncharacterized protein YndB with AHSA1/START domain